MGPLFAMHSARLSSKMDRGVIAANPALHGTLRKKLSATNTISEFVSVTDITSRAALATLSRDDLLERARTLASQHHNDTRKIEYLKNRIAKCIEANQVAVNEKVNEQLLDIVRRQLHPQLENMPPMKRLFIEQQLKVAECKSSNGMRWHPAMIRWCLALRQKSRSAYEYVKLTASDLPSNNTLDDYAHYRDVGSGIDVEGIVNLASDYAGESVSILCDEMKVKDGLVYDINTGRLVGYTDINIDTELEQMNENKIASHVLVFMIRGLKSNFKLAAATYATTTATAEQIYVRFWELVGIVELLGFKARVFVGDGASTNRRFIASHKNDYPDDTITFRAKNKFAPERAVYFASDVPHLLKTTRNNWENSGWNRNSRRLTVSFF